MQQGVISRRWCLIRVSNKVISTKFQQLALARLKELLYAGALEVETYF